MITNRESLIVKSMTPRTAALTLAIALCVASAAAQQQDRAQEQTPRFGANATAIVVDAVVRDRKGLPVTDLTREDFELYENGVRQNIEDMTMVAPQLTTVPRRSSPNRGAATSPGLPPSDQPAVPRSVVTTPTFVALVFDRLSPDARALAYKGALAYLETIHEDDFAGVFVADMSLETIHTFTNDRERLRAAIRDAATRATDLGNTGVDPQGKGLHPSTPAVASPEHEGRPAVGRGSLIAPDIYVMELIEQLERESHGYRTTDALLTLTTALGVLPGRKTVVFFAEGVAIPDAVLPRFRDVVATANRGNVSVYTIDAAGLRVHSKDAETGRAVRGMGNAGLTLSPDGRSLSSLRIMESNEDVLRRDPRTSLTMLAEQTGGFLVDNTNDLGGAFRKIDADRRFHYLLSYTPTNTDFTGEWRSLTVKVPGRSVTVRARSGYFAVRSPGLIPLLAYEAPAIAALGQVPAPRGLSMRTAAFAFPEDDTVRVAVVVSTPASDLTFSRQDATGTYATDFTILARIRNSSGEVMRKASQPYRLRGQLADVESARSGDVLFYRHPTLASGTYVLEAAVHDAISKKAGVNTLTFEIPERTRSGLQVGSLLVVRRGERVSAAERDPENPLMLNDVVLYPNLGEPVRKADQAITLFFVTSSKSKAVPMATLELLVGDKVLATLPVALDAPDAHGTVHQLAQFPTDALPPDDYVLRLVVGAGGERQIREAQVRLTQ
jgi:VWFA-related protein